MEALHGGMLLTATCGLGCTVLLERRSRLTAAVVGVVMVGVMLDMAGGYVVLAPATWAAVLVLTAIVTTAIQIGRQPRRPAMPLHRGLGLAVVAVLLLVGHPTPDLPADEHGHTMAGMGSNAVTGPDVGVSGLAAGVVALGYVVASVVVGLRHVRGGASPDRTRTYRPAGLATTVEIATMAVCVALMGVSALGLDARPWG